MEGEKKPVDMAKLARMEDKNRQIGKLIGKSIEASGGGYGFALLMFSFEGSEMTWISNAERTDMVTALKEFIETVEAGGEDELGKQKRWGFKQN